MMIINQVVFREATLADIPTLRQFEQGVIEAERPFNHSIKAEGATYYDLDDLILNDNSRIIVGELSGTLVCAGYIQRRLSKTSLSHDYHGYLGFMFVAEECRGQGLNKRVMDDLIQWGKAQGVTDFYLDVYVDNHAAVRAYEKCGFVGSLLEMKLSL